MKDKTPSMFSFGLAAFSFLAYALTLHPVSGGPGALFYMLTFWALPTIFVVSLAAGFIFLFPVNSTLFTTLKVAGLSAVLGLLPALRAVPVLLSPPHATTRIGKPIRVVPKEGRNYLDYNFESEGPTLRSGRLRIPNIATDEGCGCMYFLPSRRFKEDLGGKLSDIGLMKKGGGDVDLAIKVTTKSMPKGCAFDLLVYQGGKVESNLTVDEIPSAYLAEEEDGFTGAEHFRERFFSTTLRIFADTNLFMFVFKRVWVDPLDRAVDGFLAKAFAHSGIN